jgi:beta-barrel assembly-enhancing protease
MTKVWHYDGLSGVRYSPELICDGDQLYLKQDGLTPTPYRWADLVFAGIKDQNATYGLKDRRGWRLGFDGPVPNEIAQKLPTAEKYGRWIDRIGLWPAAGAFVALSAVALFIGLKAPDVLAPLVPASLERKLGDAMVGDFGGRVCNGPGGQAALTAIVKKIEPKTDDIKVRVVNIDMINAVALPGGNVFVFQGLLKDAKSPDEIAGVVGHEIGHVRNRDVMQALLRQMGLSVLLGGANTNVGGSLNALLSSTYSREAESKADRHSIEALRGGNISPMDTAAFFTRLAMMEKSLGKGKAALGYLSSHPLSESREAAFRNSYAKGAAYQPSTTPEQWQALINICKDDPTVAKDDKLLL